MQITLQRSGRTLTRCLVCGFFEVRTDEVFHGGLVLLHECPHCEHRWTQVTESAVPVVTSVRRMREVSAAA
ncbi:MAG: hypothetical protein JRH16_00765 [Deltaproteobacteria bacterium]|nr:hypothetical protein [Deltaproteobacteria bacterium]MBW2360860.1 hypothetical protein [Deltaproteobacteria bacterium]